MSATQAIRELIETQLDEIDHEVASLRDALRRLDDSVTAAPIQRGDYQGDKGGTESRVRDPRPRLTRRPKTRPANRRAGADVVNMQRLVAEHEGLTTARIAERAGLTRDRALAQLKELESRGELRRTGQRRGVRWHAITDEDRIRERAAELARVGKRT
jgi:CRP-like cAMP-binding protein